MTLTGTRQFISLGGDQAGSMNGLRILQSRHNGPDGQPCAEDLIDFKLGLAFKHNNLYIAYRTVDNMYA